MHQNIKISITGDLGSGKSTVCNIIAERLNIKKISTGEIQRKLATGYGMNTFQFNLYMEKNADIDKEIDNFLCSLSNADYDFIIDSRMAWHFVKNTFKVYLIVEPKIAAQRVYLDNRGLSENYSSPKEAQDNLIARKKSENERYFKMYNVNCRDYDNFNLVIDTTNIEPKDVADIIINEFNNYYENCLTKFYLSRYKLYPTKDINEVNKKIDILDNNNNSLKIILCGDDFFVYDTPQNLSYYLTNNNKVIPCFCIAKNDEELAEGVTVKEYINENCNLEIIKEFEKLYSFIYYDYPDCIR